MARKDFQAFPKGSVIQDRYVVEKSLGVGSMAIVYKCYDKTLRKRTVALKVLFNQVSEETAARFRKEIMYTYDIVHRNVLRTYDFIEEPDLTAITMEYVEGGDLRDLLESEDALGFATVIDILCQLCSGLNAIHESKIVHRDLKPENVLVTKDGVAKIADFSIAWTDTATKLTSHGGVLGSLSYISPEYLERGQLDQRTDIYGIGVIAYELLTGRLPHDGEDLAALVARVNQGAPQVSDIREDCPKALSEIIAKALEPDPDKRYQDILDMYRDLDKFSRESGIADSAPSTLSNAIERITLQRTSSAGNTSYLGSIFGKSFRPTAIMVLFAAVLLVGWLSTNSTSLNAFSLGKGDPTWSPEENRLAAEKAAKEKAAAEQKAKEVELKLAKLEKKREELKLAELEKEKEQEEFAKLKIQREAMEKELADLEKKKEEERLAEEKNKKEEAEKAKELARLKKQREEMEAKLAKLEKSNNSIGLPAKPQDQSNSATTNQQIARMNTRPAAVPPPQMVPEEPDEYTAMEYKVKATLIARFMQYVTWPSEKSSQSPRNICIVGRDPFGANLDSVVAKIHKDVHVKRYPAGVKSRKVAGCHVAFVSGKQRGNTNELVKKLNRAHVLTVTERLSAGIIHFYVHRGKVRFDVNAQQAKKAGLEIASALVKASKQS
jgi:serine/threonine protein kinase